jgi:hypothetical protein
MINIGEYQADNHSKVNFNNKRTELKKTSPLIFTAKIHVPRLVLRRPSRSVLSVWLLILLVVSFTSTTNILLPFAMAATKSGGASQQGQEEESRGIYRSTTVQDSIDKRTDSLRDSYRQTGNEGDKEDAAIVNGTNTTVMAASTSEIFQLKGTVNAQSINELDKNQITESTRSPTIESQALETGPKDQNPRQQVSIQDITSSSGFDGINQNQGGVLIGPDIGMAAGPNHIMEGVNVKFAIYNKNSGAQIALIQPQTFFGVPITDLMLDTRIIYDVLSDKWIVVITDVSRHSTLFGVSTTSDPTEEWFLYERSFGPNICPSNPTVGISDDKFALSVNQYDTASTSNCKDGTLSGTEVTVYEKAQLHSGETVAAAGFGLPSSVFNLQPTQAIAHLNTIYMVETETGEGSGNGLTLFTISGRPIERNAILTQTLFTIDTYFDPPDAVQPGTATLQDTGDVRPQQAVLNYRPTGGASQQIWFPFTTGCIPAGDTIMRSCIRLVEIRVSFGTPIVNRDITLGIANTYLYYPALTTDSSGSPRLVYGASSSTLFPSLFATGQRWNEPTEETLEPIITIKSGSQPNLNFVNGEHFAAAIDPSDTTSVWVAGQYHTIPNKWSTFISKISNVWSAFISLQGQIRSDSNPIVTKEFDESGDKLAVFVIGADNSLYYKTQTTTGSTSYTPYIPLGGIIRANSNPTVVGSSDGRLSVFVIGNDNQLWEKHQLAAGSTSWSDYVPLGGQIKANTDPVAIPGGDGKNAVFVIAADNSLYVKWETAPNSKTYTPFEFLGGQIRANGHPAVAINIGSPRLEVFAVGIDNTLYHKYQTAPGSSGPWTPFESLGGQLKPNTSPDVIRNSVGRLEVFIVGADSQLYNKWQRGAGMNSYSPYQKLSGQIGPNTDPDVTMNRDGRLEVFVVGSDNNLYHKWQNAVSSSTNYSPFASLGGIIRANTDADAEVNEDGRLEVFVIAPDNKLYHTYRTTT